MERQILADTLEDITLVSELEFRVVNNLERRPLSKFLRINKKKKKEITAMCVPSKSFLMGSGKTFRPSPAASLKYHRCFVVGSMYAISPLMNRKMLVNLESLSA
jgi:hypothetical protein